ncbi:MAG: hypothetical protein IJ814_08005 [Paludibacteraceae bacterium]|nr:hypothetical protein [Paludibacteraceae bacterium]
MKRFDIFLSTKARSDIASLRTTIIFQYRAPLTAKRYLAGLNTKIKSLEQGADNVPIELELANQYGMEIRRINYKEMAILYSIEKI